MTELCDKNDTPVLKQNKDVLMKEEKHALGAKLWHRKLVRLSGCSSSVGSGNRERRRLTNTNCSSISGEMAMSEVLCGK